MSNLIGKWVLLESMYIGGVVGAKPHLVTGVSGSRIYISEVESEWIDGEWAYCGSTHPCGFKKSTTVKFAFETLDQCILAGKLCSEELDNWWRHSQNNMKIQCRKIITENGGVSVAELDANKDGV